MNRQIGLALLAVLVASAFSPATSQPATFPYNVETLPRKGIVPNGTFNGSGIDSINVVNGGVTLQVPLASLPAGHAGMGFDVSLIYNSHIYEAEGDQTFNSNLLPPAYVPVRLLEPTDGWHYNFDNFQIRLEIRTLPDSFQCNGSHPGLGDNSVIADELRRIYRLYAILPDGSSHLLHLGSSPDGFYYNAPDGSVSATCGNSGGNLFNQRLTYYTTDGTFLKLEVTTGNASTPSHWPSGEFILYFPDGRQARGHGGGVEKIHDANGNWVQIQRLCDATCSTFYTAIRDEFYASDPNRQIRVDYVSDPSDGVSNHVITAPQVNGTISWTIDWERIHAQFTYETSAEYNLTANTDFTHQIVRSISVPSTPSTSYVFSYQSEFGELTEMIVPTGAKYQYAYDNSYKLTDYERALDNPIVTKKVIHDGVTDQWTYNISDTSTTVTHPDGGQHTHYFENNHPTSTAWNRGFVYKIAGPNGAIREQVWAQNKPGYDVPPNNPFVVQERETVGGVTPQTAITDFAYDKNGNLLSKTEYAWVNYGAWGNVKVTAGLTVQRRTVLTYNYIAPDSSDPSNSTRGYWRVNDPLYWSQTDPRRLDAVQRRQVSDGTTVVSLTEFSYDSPFKNGNVTSRRTWDTVKNPSIGSSALSALNSQVLSSAYDSRGNLIDICSGCSNSPDDSQIRTHISYGNYPYPTKVEYGYGSPIQRTFTYQWNATLGLLLVKMDADNNRSTTYAFDQAGRVIEATEASMRATRTRYDDASRVVTVRRDLASLNDGKLQSITRFDQLGRAVLVQTRDTSAILDTAGVPVVDATAGIKVRTIYKTMFGGRLEMTSTPARNADYSDVTTQWTCRVFDQSNRLGIVSVFKGAASPEADLCEANASQTSRSETSYDANRIHMKDPAGKSHDRYTDALGRLIRVIEDPGAGHLNYITDYAYDPLDNLTSVVQGGQTRTFQYSSLGRLKQMTNPENGTLEFTYFDNGLLKTRKDGRDFVLSMSYDALQRVKTKIYSDPVTPDVDYSYYSSGPNRVGELQTVSSSAISTTFSNYDSLGRLGTLSHTIDSSTYTMSYAHNLADKLTSFQYPSGMIVSYGFDDAGRPNKAETAEKKYVDMTAYTADGRLRQMKLGNNLFETREYSTPGTPTRLQLGTGTTGTQLNDRIELQYNYSPTQNNGNILSHSVIRGGATWTQSFSYDALNRITAASEANGFSNTYGYDRYGNRWVSAKSGMTFDDVHEPTQSTNFNAANNRLMTGTYDAAGNLQTYDPRTLQYDGENRIHTVTSSGAGSGQFVYDSEGHRIKKSWTPGGGATITTVYVHDAAGRVVAEFSSAPSAGAGTEYTFSDLLGSVRAVTNASGAIVECYDYLPYGRMLSASDNGRSALNCHPANPDSALNSRIAEKFIGKQRDIETGLDLFGARYFSAGQGRFISADPFNPITELDGSAFDDYLANPQYWNRYAYGLNNPLKYKDPDGQNPLVLPMAALGAGLSAGQEIAIQAKSGNWDGWKILAKAAGGALTGAVGALTGGLNVFVQVGASVVTETAAGMLVRAVDNDATKDAGTPSEVAKDSLGGLASGLVGHAINRHLKPLLAAEAALETRLADHAKRATTVRTPSRRLAARALHAAAKDRHPDTEVAIAALTPKQAARDAVNVSVELVVQYSDKSQQTGKKR